MKRCPQCRQEFDDDRILCATDGTELVPMTGTNDLLIGLTIDGKYKAIRRIGKGGMGAVYIANHTKFNKQVAIKVLSKDMMEDPTSFERFKREAEASARIKHPNVVQVLDFGQTEAGLAYMVMEYIDGISLRRLIDRERRLLPVRAVEIARQICAAIAAAHRAQIVHRDLKPDNVMIEIIDGKETARVLDFGIAKLKDSQGRITKTDSVLGTPHYMSPEQCSGGTIDQRSDIYSLGIMLYEMLSGDVPFLAQSAPAIIVQHVTKDPTPLIEHCPSVPEPLSRVVMRALDKQQERRQQTASDLAAQLEAALDLAGTPHSAPRSIPTGNVSQWQVLFHGMLDSSETGRKRLLEGLQRSFGLSAAKAAELIDGQRVRSVKKTNSQEEAYRVAERLRVIGADVKVEAVVTELPPPPPPTDLGNAKTEVSPRKVKVDETKTSITHKYSSSQVEELDKAVPAKPSRPGEIVRDPLVVMDGSEMLSYATERERSKNTAAPNAEQTDALTEPAMTAPVSQPTGGIRDVATQHIPSTVAEAWSIDINGLIYENMSDDDVEAWIRASRIRHTHRARKGKGNWHDVGQIGQFRRIFEEISPHIFQPISAMEFEAKQDEDKRAGSLFLGRFIKLSVVIFVLYILGNFTMLYSQQRFLEDDLRVVLSDTTLTVTALRGRITTAVKQRGIDTPKENVHITVDQPNRRVSVRVDYNRKLLGIPLHYQAKREISNFNLPIELLAQIPDGDLDIVGMKPGEIDRYRRDQAAKKIADKMSTYQGEQVTLREREDIQTELRELEGALPLFSVTSADETGRLVYPKSVKLREKEYTQEEIQARISELRSKLIDVERQLDSQKARKQAEAETEANKILKPNK